MRIKLVFILISFIGLSNLFGQVKTDSLLLYYPFAGNANDASGNQFNGQQLGAVNDTDRFNNQDNSFYFDGINDYIEVPSNSTLRPSFPFSVSLWVKIEQLNSGFVTLYSSCEIASVYSGFNIKYSPTGLITVQYGNGLGTAGPNRRGRIATTPLTIGNWHHVAVSFKSSSEIHIYIDGEDKSGAYSGTASNMVYTTQPGAIGKNLTPNGAVYHKGSIDDVRLYNDSLKLNQAQYLSFESPCVSQISVLDTIAVFDTVDVINTIQVYDTITNYTYTSAIDTMYIDLAQNPSSIKLYAAPSNTELIIDVGSNQSSMLGHSISINDKFGQQVYFTQINSATYAVNLMALGYIGLFQFYITDPQGLLITNRKLLLY